MFRHLTIFLMVFCHSTGVLALDPSKAITQYTTDSWTIEDGLPQNTIEAITQSSQGYLWMGTQEGLVRFDGVRFTIFDVSNTPIMADDFISCVTEDHNGNIWVATRAGLLLLSHGQFTAYTTEDGLSGNIVRDILPDAQGSIWFGTRKGLSRFKDGVFSVYTTKDGLAADIVGCLEETSDGTLWIGTAKGLSRLRDGKFTTYGTAHGLPDSAIYCVHESRDGVLWVGTNRGLSRFHEGRFSTYGIENGLSHDAVHAIVEDRDGNLWIGTNGGGLNRLTDGRITSYSEEDGLPSNFIRPLYEDREGSLWMGTYTGGLFRLKDGDFTTYTTREGLSYNNVSAVYEDRDSTLWIGTFGGGLNRLEDDGFRIYTTHDGLSNNHVWSLAGDCAGNLWIGTYGGGLNRLRDGKIKTLTTKDGLSNDFIRAILEDREGTLWIGTNGGLNSYRNGRFISYTIEDGLAGNTVHFLHEDRQGNLWIGTGEGGLSRFSNGAFTTYDIGDGLSDDMVYAIHEEEDGTFWIGASGGGLKRFRDGLFATISSRDGLFDDRIYRILEDDEGNFWMSCNKGVFRVSKKELHEFVEGRIFHVNSVAYGKLDGMKSREANGGSQPSGWRRSDGGLWFPTILGVTVVHPANLITNAIPPPVVIEDLFVDEQPLHVDGRVEIKPGTEKLEFHYAALSFLAPSKVQFKYKLEGFDRAWVDVGMRRTAYYTNVPPGDYQFKVIASNEDGVWNEEGASIEFSLKPFFYERPVFYLLCVLIAISGILIFVMLRTRRLERQRRKLEEMVVLRTGQLQESEERYALAAQAANDGLWDWNLQINEIRFGARWIAMLGLQEGISNRQEEWFDRVHPDDIERLKRDLDSHLAGNTPSFENEHRMLHADGTYRWMLSRGIAVRNATGEIHRMVGSLTDITERGVYDALTGLPNQILFMARLEQSFQMMERRDGFLFAVLVIGIDQFRVVTESLGPVIGAQLLMAAARVLKDCLGKAKMIGRLDGDRFIVLLDDLRGAREVLHTAQIVEKELEAPIQLAGHEVFTTASIGIALSSTGYERPEQIVHDASTAMHRARGHGKSHHEVFDTAMRAQLLDRLEMETALQKALTRSELCLFYQPIVGLKSGRIVGFEALIRWYHPTRGLVLPEEFIPTAEETGLIVPMGQWTLREACLQVQSWQRSFPSTPLSVSVNLSGKEFSQADIVGYVEETLRETRLDPRSLRIEITESAIMENAHLAASLLEQLRALEILLCIDDFGTGYSSLSYLQQFPIDILKIDQSFVHRIDSASTDVEIVRTVVALAHALGMEVVAEGVETALQLRQLRAIGCEYVQGFYFSPAVAPEAAGVLLEKDPRW